MLEFWVWVARGLGRYLGPSGAVWGLNLLALTGEWGDGSHSNALNPTWRPVGLSNHF